MQTYNKQKVLDFMESGTFKSIPTISWNFKNVECFDLKDCLYIGIILHDTEFSISTIQAKIMHFIFVSRFLLLIKESSEEDILNYILPNMLSVGTYNDIFNLLRIDLEYNINPMIDWDTIFMFIDAELIDPNKADFVKKYMPKIRCKSQCHTYRHVTNSIIGKKLAKFLYAKRIFPDICTDNKIIYNYYRKLKSSGNANTWKQYFATHENTNEDLVPKRVLLNKDKYVLL